MRGIIANLAGTIKPWRRILVSNLLLVFCVVIVTGQYYGMQFRGHEYSLDQRSGLDLTPNGMLHHKGTLDVEFYLRFDPDHQSYFGYIFRLLLEDQNIDLIHGEVPPNPNNFELIIGDRTSNIAFHVPIDSLTTRWLHLKFHFDLKSGQITAFVQGKEMTDSLNTVAGKNSRGGFRLMFGAHSIGRFSSTDVPAMIIRDVQVKTREKQTYHWPLNETEGFIAHSIPAGKDGSAVNPEWLLKQHNTWKMKLDMEVEGIIKAAFDQRNECLYMVTADSVYLYYVTNDSMSTITNKASIDLERYCNIIFDTLSSKLWLYSVDNNYLTSFDPETGEWSDYAPGTEPLTSYWHHNRLITPDGSLMVFGGYGYHTYKNMVLRWNSPSERFDTVEYSGTYDPRYLAGAGFNPSDGKFYLIGGYGSESGKQSESPDYYYEILSYSIQDHSFSTVQQFKDIDPGFCFANSVIFDHRNNLYGLYFPKYEFENRLQLVRIHLGNQEIVELGNPIDYRFMDVQSYADLYYCKSQDALLALSTFWGEESSSLTLRSIAFPPQAFEKAGGQVKNSMVRIALYVIAGAGLLLYLLFVLFPRKKKASGSAGSPGTFSMDPVPRRKENSILLFGGFQIFDKEGKDITGQFTPLPKKLLLYILLHTLRNEKGVSSNALYETFWFDKSVESARNNRAVNIVKLKSLLEKLEGTTISKDAGYWKFEFDPGKIYIDYYEYLKIVHRTSELEREDMVALLAIVEKSPFLNNTQAEWLDSFKSDVSNEIIDTFLKYVNHTSDDPEFLLHLTNCIFVFDMVSEEALKLQCRLLIKQGKHSLAKSAYSKFTKEYQQLYDEEYALSFSQVIGEQMNG